jgi:WD40 repeat protein
LLRQLLAAAYGDGYVRLWSLSTGHALDVLLADTTRRGSVNALPFSPDGTLLAAADADGTVRIWRVSLLADPYAALCAEVGPPTAAEWAEYAPGEPQPTVCT